MPLLLADLNGERLEPFVRSLQEHFGVTARGIVGDVTDPAVVQKCVRTAEEELGGCGVLVNNAGISMPGPIEKVALSDWERVLRVNLTGPFLCSQAVFPGMKRAGWGRIINIASFAGKRPTLFGENVSYTASKAGLIGLTKALAFDGAPYGITVNGVAPGPVETDMLLRLPEENRKKLASLVPAGRLATPEDVAGVVFFLASEAASYITGETVNLNGGLYMD